MKGIHSLRQYAQMIVDEKKKKKIGPEKQGSEAPVRPPSA